MQKPLLATLALGLLPGPAALAQHVYHPDYQSPQRLFPEVVLAARADWYRPDLAARRVHTLTRRFARRGDWQPLGDARRLAERYETAPALADSVREVLTYDATGRLLRYTFTLHPSVRQGKRPQLVNDFQYDAAHQLTRIRVSGAPQLTETDESLSLDAYLKARWPAEAVGSEMSPRHRVAGDFQNELQTMALRELRFIDVDGKPLSQPRAVLVLRSARTRPGTTGPWLDSVILDPLRGFQIVSNPPRDLRADTTWLHPSVQWTSKGIAPAATGLRLHHLTDYYQAKLLVGLEKDYDGLTCWYDSAGDLRLSRMANHGTVLRCRYGPRHELLEASTYRLRLPHQRPALELFGYTTEAHYHIVDCEGRFRRWLPLPDGQRGVLEQELTQQVRYETAPTGLVSRAVVQNIRPDYVPDVRFEFEMPPAPPCRGRAPTRETADMRKARHRREARRERTNKYLQAGCVPMKAAPDDHVVTFRYTFFK